MTLLSPAVDETVTATTHVGAQDLPARPSARETVSQSLPWPGGRSRRCAATPSSSST